MALVVYTGGGTKENYVNSHTTGAGGDSNTSSLRRPADGFVGLSNQGATCYLNGLLQTLFMTPEFRRAIYTWRYDEKNDGDADKCIPLQLQRLFGFLQLSKSRFVTTVGLTRSFEWEDGEVFQQQDVQELTRVLFDALGTFTGNGEGGEEGKNENVIDQIYAGELIDYLRCIDVDYQSERVDKFLDLSLAIVPFGSSKAMHSLSQCIDLFLRPEILEGDNKYFAECVNRKVDAIKGLKFGKLPHIMSVQLKRFVYDFSGHSVVQKKLNDVVRFPMILDMNKYVSRKYRARSRTSSSSNPSGHLDNQKPSALTSLSGSESTTVGDTKNETLDGGAYEEIEIEADEFERFLLEQMTLLRKQQADKENKASSSLQNSSSSGSGSGSGSGNNDKDHGMDAASGKFVGGLGLMNLESFDEDIDIEDIHTSCQVPDLVSYTGDKCPDQLLEEEAILMDKRSMTREEIKELVERRGEWVYELFSVLIHSGAIAGGHYYAYIKDLDTQKWWNFNDSNVTSISEDQVREAWGNATKVTSSMYGKTTTTTRLSSSNAYMLMYRKVSTDSSKKPAITFPDDSLVPDYIRDAVRKEDEEIAKREVENERRLNEMYVKVYWKGEIRNIRGYKFETYESFLSKLYDELQVYAEPEFLSSSCTSDSNSDINVGDESSKRKCPIDRLRLRTFDFFRKVKTSVFDLSLVGNKTLSELDIKCFEHYTLETRKEGEEWEIYHVDGVTVFIEIYDPITKTFQDPRSIRLPRDSTVGNLKSLIASWTPYGVDKMRLQKFIFSTHMNGHESEVYNDNERLIKFHEHDSTFYVEEELDDCISTPETGITKSQAQSPAKLAWEIKKYSIIIRHNCPPSKDMDRTLVADLRWQIKQLRAAIAKSLDLSEEYVRLYRGSNRHFELKDTSFSLSGSQIHDKATIEVVIGKVPPLGFHYMNVSIYTHQFNKPGIRPLPEIQTAIAADIKDEEREDHVEVALVKSKDAEPPFTHSVSLDKTNPITNDVMGVVRVNATQLCSPLTSEYSSESRATTTTLSSTSLSHIVAATPVGNGQNDSHDNGGIIDDRDDRDDRDAWTTGTNSPQSVNDCGTAKDYFSSEDNTYDTPEIKEATAATITPNAEAAAMRGGSSSFHPLATLTTVTAIATATVIHEVVNEADMANAEIGYVVYDSNEPSSIQTQQVQTQSHQPHTIHVQRQQQQEGEVQKLNAEVECKTVDSSDDNIISDSDAEEINDFGQRTIQVSSTVANYEVIEWPEPIIVNGETSVSSIREKLADYLKALGKLPAHATPSHLRLRCKEFDCNVGKILRGERSLNCMNVDVYYENKAYCVQILDSPEDLPPAKDGDVILMVQRWHRSSWSLGERFEVILNGDMSVREISQRLGILTGIPCETMRALVVPSNSELRLCTLDRDPDDVSQSKWFQPAQINQLLKNLPSSQSQTNLRLKDGDLLLLQDSQEPLRPLTKADRRSIELVEQANKNESFYSKRVTYTGSPIGYTYDSIDTPHVPYTAVTGTSKPRSNGVRIKSHKERLKDEASGSTAAESLTGNSANHASSEDLASCSPLLEASSLGSVTVARASLVEDDFYGTGGWGISNSAQASSTLATISERELAKHGGMALFSDCGDLM